MKFMPGGVKCYKALSTMEGIDLGRNWPEIKRLTKNTLEAFPHPGSNRMKIFSDRHDQRLMFCRQF